MPHGKAKRAGQWSWRLGSVFGIDVYLHATFLIFLLWVGVSHLVQGEGTLESLEGVALILCVFGIVILHELGHALTAQRFGIGTRSIMLLPIGGVASLERIPEKPIQELLVALAGPAVNVVLALGFFVVILSTGGTLSPLELGVVGGSFLTKLMWINVAVAVFNMLPAFPMDGGRVLRAGLAFKLDYSRATEVATKIGQGMALLFGIVGLFFNPMLMLIALFVWMGARQESAMIQLKSALSGLPIRRAMITEFRTLSPMDPLRRVSTLMLAGFQHDFPVIDAGRPVGLLTREDVLRGLAEGNENKSVGDVMRRDFATASPTELFEGALAKMNEHEARSLVVVESGQVVGVLMPENIGELVVVESAVRPSRLRAA